MDPNLVTFIGKLSEQGVLGIIVVILGYVLRYIFKSYEAKLDVKDGRIAELQKRAEDLQLANEGKVNDARVECAAKLSDALKAKDDVIRALQLEKDELQSGRVNDAKAYGEQILSLSDRVHQTTDKLADMVDRVVPAPATYAPVKR